MGLLESMLMTSGMFGAGFGSAPAGGNPNTVQQSRAMRYLRPPTAPLGHPGAPHLQGGGNPFFNQGGSPGDYSQYTYDYDANQQATQALSPYGLKPLDPGQVNPFTIFPNHGFFANHPGLTGRLEGAIYGAASARPGLTTGDTITNSLQAMLEGPQLRNAAWQRQFQAPFAAAGPLEALQGMQAKRELNDSEQQYHLSKIQNAQDMLELRGRQLDTQQQLADTKQQLANQSGAYQDVMGENAAMRARAAQETADASMLKAKKYQPGTRGPKSDPQKAQDKLDENFLQARESFIKSRKPSDWANDKSFTGDSGSYDDQVKWYNAHHTRPKVGNVMGGSAPSADPASIR